ncbi:MAG: hypothetical protein HYZ49_02045 [Chloroflexi bacterium]|nr:hypothetical protein [Chloroflexota bacterium]
MRKFTSRVLIVGSGSLADEGLEKLLAGKSGLELLHVTYTDDATFLHQFSQFQPEVVVLFEGSPLTVSRLFELTKEISVSDLRVITVLAQTNTVEMYAKRQITVGGSKDFLALVHSTEGD